YTDGVFFSNATLKYASSVTCLGHATLSTGTYPMKSGILDNEWINPSTRKSVYCVEDTASGPVDGEGGGSSPNNLLVTGIGDWLKASSSQSKVITASGKDRAAILMGGKHPDYAFWYNRKNGHMVTSNYYTQHEPEWERNFNSSNWIEKNVPASWTKLLPDSVYTKEGPDEFSAEAGWDSSTSFPHKFSDSKKNGQILTTPYGDMLVLDFARKAIEGEKLGQRSVTDLLCLSLSDCDYIGHAFGPNSHEIMDHLFRLDIALGSFFSEVDSMVGSSHVLVVLSADHGVMPLPEFLVQFRRQEARRILYPIQIKTKIDSIDLAIRKGWNIQDPIFETGGFLNYAAAARVGKDSIQLEQRAGEALRHVDGIADVYFRRELIDVRTPGRPYLEEFRRSYYPPRGEDFQIRYCENCLVENRSVGTTHGSVYSYDTHVPIVFLYPGITAKYVQRRVHIVDIAPTLARILNIDYPTSVDGVPMEEFK
ncbi:MAG: alkaline phosphatase family protein, partial [Bacteroidota bacterium]